MSKVFVGNVNTATIDIGDIKALNGRIASSAGALIHETEEQYRIQVKKLDNVTAHKKATIIENTVTGYNTDYRTRLINDGNIPVQSEKCYYGGSLDLSKSGYLEYINFDSNNNIIYVTPWIPLKRILLPER